LGPPEGAVELAGRLRETELRLAAEAVDTGRPRLRRRLVRSVRQALREPASADETELALGLADVLVRDEVLTWSVVDGEPLLTLLLRLARCTPAPYDAGVCATLAWVAYSRGDGATASIALDRALATDPEHGLAGLLRSALDRQVPPKELRAVAALTAGVLRGGRALGAGPA
ncbi:MAG: hypothetical protein JWO60_1360, partial [Frankiales bacterium]|nr:hypothetical protein [Frankiales bacterium]